MQKIVLVIVVLALLPFNVFSADAGKRGYEIAKEADDRDVGWKDSTAQVVMTLRNKRGDESVRENRMRSLEVPGDGDKSIIIFDSPADVKGTAFLSHTHAKKSDDQWLFLPALKRIKRISSSNKSGPFMGSEFAYEDISSQELEKYSYKYLKDEVVNGKDTFVIERIPEYKKSGYSKQLVWIDKEIYQPLKVEFYDRKKTLLKTLTYHDYKQYVNKYWRSLRMEMNNHQTGKSTTLAWKSYEFQTGLSDRDFDKNALKRMR